jgi:tight adherence protein B
MLFGMNATVLAMVGLIGFSVAALLYGLFYGRVQQQAQTEKRIDRVGAAAATAKAEAKAPSTRRRNVQDTLKDIEVKQKHKASKSTNPPLSLRLQQAGIEFSVGRFYLFSALAGMLVFVLVLVLGMPLILSLGAAFVGAAGLPRYVVNFLRKRRQAAFVNELANAVEVIVRGVKAGLPLHDCLRMIASEAQEPIKTEFRQIVESLQLGVPIDEAVGKMYERMPLAECNFFAIVLSIQAKAGGNLSEALGNLAKVLRERKKMKAKIQAMSTEAKSSAAIIGSLPIIVGTLVYLTSPEYIMVLFTTLAGKIVVGASACVMGAGIYVMKRMISFDF